MVPGFRLERLIGEGGFGQVWRGVRLLDNTRVAIKILHAELVRSVDALTRFGRELDAIGRLQHPNVVGALGHGALIDGRPYLVLEYIDGPSLREVLQDRRGLPPSEMLEVLGPIADALEVSHRAGLVHRDVKASNVILGRTAAGALRPVLLDFGLVKLIDDVGPGLTSSRSMLGTPTAMAPEQMRGQAVDARTDVYALGLLAYHLLTGQPAFGGSPGVVQSYMQIHGTRPRPSAKVDIDPALDEPIVRALATDPEERYPSARQLFEALRDIVTPPATREVEVVALYVEANAPDVTSAIELATSLGMTIALTAPDSMLAVGPRDLVDVGALRAVLAPISGVVAIGVSTATLGAVVDGQALDVEGWAPYPLPSGMWVSEGL
ncbi:MAG: serine/threonine-protein kinase [Kofleriaceae bacterium]|nr:serine/threonine-protein kinase [Kofleriaceae bacterium]